MRLPWTPQFDVERQVYRLRFTCDDCAHFDAASGACRHEWPNEPHRSERPLVEGALASGAVDFCKEFELC